MAVPTAAAVATAAREVERMPRKNSGLQLCLSLVYFRLGVITGHARLPHPAVKRPPAAVTEPVK